MDKHETDKTTSGLAVDSATTGYAAIPWGLKFRESDLGQAINCTKMEKYFHHDNPELKTYLTEQINHWLDFHRAKHNTAVE